MISIFHKDYTDKLSATLPPIDFALPITKSKAKPRVKPLNIAKRKRGQSAKDSLK